MYALTKLFVVRLALCLVCLPSLWHGSMRTAVARQSGLARPLLARLVVVACSDEKVEAYRHAVLSVGAELREALRSHGAPSLRGEERLSVHLSEGDVDLGRVASCAPHIVVVVVAGSRDLASLSGRLAEVPRAWRGAVHIADGAALSTPHPLSPSS